MHQKFFERGGVVARDPVMVKNSLLQGCPMSMLLLAAQSTTWVKHVKEKAQDVDIGICVDDRSLFVAGPGCVKKLEEATRVGDELDKAFGWKKHKDKIQCYGRGRGVKKQLQALEDDLGPYKTEFKLLGIEYTTTKRRRCQDSEKGLEKCMRRLDRIRVSCRSMWTRRKMIKALVLSKVKYSGAWTTPKKTTLRKLETKIERTILTRTVYGRSRFLVWSTLLGSDLHPGHCLDLECLRHECWRFRKTLKKQVMGQDLMNMPQQASRWDDICRKWQWKRRPGTIAEYDTPDGFLDLGACGAPAIKAMTDRAFYRCRWAEDNRCKEALTASVERFTVPCTAIHTDIVRDAVLAGHSARLKSSIGAAPDHRVIKALMEKQNKTGTVTCLCGQLEPDREHMLWKCEHAWEELDHDKARLPRRPMPLSERKLAVPRFPKGKRSERDEVKNEDVQKLVISLRDASQRGERLFIGTDGGAIGRGAFDRHAAWSAVTMDTAVHGILRSIDSSSFYAEIFAALVALCAVASIGLEVTLIIDNRAVQHGIHLLVTGEHTSYVLPKHFCLIWKRIHDLKIHGLVNSWWVPSHGKKPEWTAPDEEYTEKCRKLNEIADKHASSEAEAASKRASSPPTVVLDRCRDALERLRYVSDKLVKRYLGGGTN
jgi:ribonuclease HI